MLQVDQLVDRIRTYQPSVDSDLIQRAYDYSYRMHAGQKRKSGQPYIVHPVSVAGIIADLKLDGASVCAGLLHDVIEDTLATPDDIAKEFGPEVAELVDRLDNMRTLTHMKPEAQERIARETLDIYAPLANRLGIQAFKSELEDLSFKHLEPDHYGDLVAQLTKLKRERDKYIAEVCKTLSSRLAEQGFAAEVNGRAKH